jgi:four helix bundle protein
MQEIKSYKDLVVWQKSHQLANRIFDLVEEFPKTRGAEIVINQVLRSCSSIPANLAEGYGGRKGNEFISYLYQARRSIPETDYWLYLSSQRKYIDQNEYEKLSSEYSEVLKMINSMISKLKR